MTARTAVRSLEIACWALVLLCAAALLVARVEAAAAGASAAAMRGTHASETSPQPRGPAKTASGPESRAGKGLLGRLEIPALHLSTPIVDDDDNASLLRGAGHIRGTAMPGGLGNFVIAAHRDTYFRPLSGIKQGMSIRIITQAETFTYIVDSFKVVNPEDVYVLDMGDVPQLTLITCYPFHYIGAAPQRFTVSAHLASF